MAGLAALFVTAPIAHATPAPGTESSAPSSSDESGSAATVAPKVNVAPQYGYQKYRVGVRGKQGDYYPGDTTTAGTKLHVVETGSDGEVDRDFTCTTEPNDPNDVLDATFCPGEAPRFFPPVDRAAKSVKEPTPAFAQNVYYPERDATVTVTQTTPVDNMVKDTSTETLQPCPATDGDFYCLTTTDELPFPFEKGTDLIFVDPGIPPVAVNDSAKTKEGVAVDIAIAPNDTPKAPIKTVEIVADPKHGTARLITAEQPDPAPSSTAATTPPVEMKAPAGSRSLAAVTSYRAIYTPKDGFIGIDTFDYTIATANGTATAKVTVTVTGVAAASDTVGSDVSANTDAVAETGAPSGQLLGYGVALMVAGGGAVALGTKRRRGRHAR